MDKRLIIYLRIVAIIMIVGSATGAGFSWVYMTRKEAIVCTLVASFTVVMWINLWRRLERMFKEVTRLQAEIERIFLDIMSQLFPK